TDDSIIPGSTNLYGTYQIRVHYYRDSSKLDWSSDPPQEIVWHLTVKYLAYKNSQTGQEFWIEKSRDGILSTPNPDSFIASDFNSVDVSWSNIWSIDYGMPNPADFGIPNPPQNVFS
ncbi:MAG: hypothetical protein PHC63_05400, partial [Candidatus Bathyarchaeota archaeon]|nr:hypothetical protein [Candidatus Bathyarchaeota archaeon]